ncbi:Protease OS=Streptomyces glaucescens OX=1907 GN=SGLAU_27440 PE=3 SV=1 [Streptomyces glaucescens]
MRIAFLTAPEGVEQVELTDPWQAAEDAGHQPVLVSTKPAQRSRPSTISTSADTGPTVD